MYDLTSSRGVIDSCDVSDSCGVLENWGIIIVVFMKTWSVLLVSFSILCYISSRVEDLQIMTIVRGLSYMKEVMSQVSVLALSGVSDSWL
jgi:hypothetical protein